MSPSCPSQTLPDLTGSVVGGNLKLIALLGAGAYGKVYKARIVTAPVGHYLAVKCMWRYKRGSSEDVAQAKEIHNHKVVSKHRGVVTLHRQIVTDKYTFVVLEYAHNDLFRALVDRKVFRNRPALIKGAINEIIDALAFMHRKGVYHRDIKPENLLCDRDGQNIRFADFGLSTHKVSSTRFGCGSMSYMPPESLDSNHPAASDGFSSAASDMWAVAIMFCTFVSDSIPWLNADVNDRAYSYFLTHENFLLSSLNITRETNDLLKRCFDFNPEKRPTLEEFRDAVNAIERFSAGDPEVVSPSMPESEEAESAHFSSSALSSLSSETNISHSTPPTSPAPSSSSQSDAVSAAKPTLPQKDAAATNRPARQTCQRPPFLKTTRSRKSFLNSLARNLGLRR
ncbi:Protein kinase domain-containing protein [Mycena indigotica]|uniref:Protein kinase domain-containing protein n=1 Tax=Mycena indigotica TaxID=2126181 RepID=A0A8H6T8C2_9AGAR|nr:Protein kinase domain-containing protein [Mycena indigotica]KAF7312756.1 Protein kinase domain-containing protein [Mycena indigotica]